METQNNHLTTVILLLTLITLGALLVSATSVIIESTLALYCWYLALTCMGLLLLLWIVMFFMLVGKMLNHWYEREYSHHAEI